MMLKGLTVQYCCAAAAAEDLAPGDTIVWHAAAGGVGLIACQWAKALGCKLIGTAGPTRSAPSPASTARRT